MAERIVSPAVFTQEKDLTYLQTGVGEIGSAVIGPTVKGPAFVPTLIQSTDEFIQIFGEPDAKSYVPYLVDSYMTNAGRMTVVKVLGLDGYDHTGAYAIAVKTSGSIADPKIIALFHRSNATEGDLSASTITQVGSSSVFYLTLSGSGVTAETYTASLDTTSASFIGKVFSHTPETTNSGYLYGLWESYLASGTVNLSACLITGYSARYNFTDTDYTPAETPYITSQTIGGITKNLFKFRTISDGVSANQEIKVGIIDIRKASEVAGSDYGTFTVLIRRVGDTDKLPEVLETYNNVTLDPDASNYIGKVIGDKYAVYDSAGKALFVGDYANKSRYISVQVEESVKNKSNSAELIPWGFAAIKQPASSSYNMPSASFVTTQEYQGEYNAKMYYGFDYSFTTCDNQSYLQPIPTGATVGTNVAFNLDNYTVHASASGYENHSFATDSTPLSARRFIVPFQGGFDGMDPATPKYVGSNITTTNTMGFNLSSGASMGSIAYQRAFNLLANQDQYDINGIFTPGVIKSLHSSVVVAGIELCEDRGDAFYVFDNSPITTTTLTMVVDNVSTIDSNYAATYFPWIKIEDKWSGKYLWVPPSVVVAGAISYTDKNAYQWYAPAGLNRGVLNAVDVYFPLKQTERDVLYEGRVNPIATFPNEGVVVWGQKTLQTKASALDRINVRRLLIALKKYIASASRYLVFEQNTSATRNKFLNIVNPYLESVQQRQGLYAFKVVMDETNNTPDLIDRNILYGQIYIQPARAAEFIIIDFNIMPTGAVFGS